MGQFWTIFGPITQPKAIFKKNVSKELWWMAISIIFNTKLSAGNGRFWQQNVIQDRKSFITQSKLMIFWWNKKSLKPYDLLLLFVKKIELHFGCSPCCPNFCPNRVPEEQFLTTLLGFFENYNMITQVININSMFQHTSEGLKTFRRQVYFAVASN